MMDKEPIKPEEEPSTIVLSMSSGVYKAQSETKEKRKKRGDVIEKKREPKPVTQTLLIGQSTPPQSESDKLVVTRCHIRNKTAINFSRNDETMQHFKPTERTNSVDASSNSVVQEESVPPSNSKRPARNRILSIDFVSNDSELSDKLPNELPKHQDKKRMTADPLPHHCVICKSQLKVPILLECLHSACKDCIEKIIEKRKGLLVCPVCTKEQSIDVRRLPINYIEMDYLKKLEIRNTDHICDICPQDDPEYFKMLPVSKEFTSKAQGYCCECDQYLCRFHLNDHKRTKGTSKHDLILNDSIQESTENVSIRFCCQIHSTEPFTLFCETCRLMICKECVLSHQGHKSLPIRAYYDTNKDKLIQLANSAEDKVNDLTHYIDLIDSELSYLSESKETVSREIVEWKKAIKRLINVRCDVLCDEVDKTAERKGKTLREYLGELNEAHVNLAHVLDFAFEASVVGGVQILNLKSVLTPALAGASAIRSIEGADPQSVKAFTLEHTEHENITAVFQTGGALQATAQWTENASHSHSQTKANANANMNMNVKGSSSEVRVQPEIVNVNTTERTKRGVSGAALVGVSAVGGESGRKHIHKHSQANKDEKRVSFAESLRPRLMKKKKTENEYPI